MKYTSIAALGASKIGHGVPKVVGRKQVGID